MVPLSYFCNVWLRRRERCNDTHTHAVHIFMYSQHPHMLARYHHVPSSAVDETTMHTTEQRLKPYSNIGQILDSEWYRVERDQSNSSIITCTPCSLE